MARSNVDAIYEEHPFLSRIIARVKVPDAQVKRWSEEFLASAPRSHAEGPNEKIYLVDENGGVVAKVDTWLAFLKNNGRKETVGQALARIGNKKVQVRYAVGVDDTVTVWKLPNGYDNVADWLQFRIEEARKELNQS